MSFNVLFIGDIVGRISRQAIKNNLGQIKKDYNLDMVIANAENAAHGTGITAKIYNELIESGIDLITLGDHAFDKEEASQILSDPNSRMIRPANFPPHLPGSGYKIIESGTKKILLINLLGRVFMKMDYDCPFRAVDEILNKTKDQKPDYVIVDFHAEATSEKIAFGWHTDGRVSAVIGSHTHVPTADVKTLPKGTGYVSDVGMVGAADSVIGAKKEPIINMFLSQVSKPIEPAEDYPVIFNSILLDFQGSGIKSISRVDKEFKL